MADISFAGRVAVVTGSRRGIGKAMALAFAGAGADIAASDIVIEDGQLEAVAKQAKEMGRQSITVRADVTSKADIENLVLKTIAAFGHIDIWVNNAGVPNVVPILEQTEEQWDKVIDTHLKGCYLCSQAIAKKIIERKAGVIINIASTAGLGGSPSSAAYASAKAGIISLTRAFATALGPYGIRVNAIAPGFVRTDMVSNLWTNDDWLKDMESRVPLGRIAEPADIANVGLLLASELASYVTGQVIVADGGSLAYTPARPAR